MTTFKKIIIVLIALFVLTGCVKNSDNMQEIKAVGGGIGHFVYTYTDKEAGVTYICTSDGGITPRINYLGGVFQGE
uniref:Prokaryotic membrane lipoprotein lipid attachment site n=1 Tax=Podoviridae sp. ct2nF21 TaxID=2826537 RepID=A0A8S5NH94_9CAUD|nr:MAG TPA: Prokaryotic membrane lipoprotein lipid attachment site [Podoviridae sp. ct2nF21]